jgi:hypothetical protein
MGSLMPLPKREYGNAFEAMKMESAFVDWLKAKEAVHHNTYRILFEQGALEPLMQFLARSAIGPQLIIWLASFTHIPILAKRLLKDPSHRRIPNQRMHRSAS